METLNKAINIILGLSMIVNSIFAVTQLLAGNIYGASTIGVAVFLAWVALHMRGKIEENPESMSMLAKILTHGLTAFIVLSFLVGFLFTFILAL